MKTLIIYASIHHGNTEKIANVMAEGLNADLMKMSKLNPKSLADYDLIGFGSGIYYGKFHKDIIKLIDNLPELLNRKAFVFSTSGQGKKSYNSSIEIGLKNKGFQIIGSFACKGYDTFGPFKVIGGIAKGRPDNDDLKNAMDFVKEIKGL
ncbi:flavodoxin family protein [Tissierella praeacuta]|uniref:flavodoxin family protein n=1 Tax=Tissierella praeacuta TaxID=43131 RepID=UPI00333E52BB